MATLNDYKCIAVKIGSALLVDENSWQDQPELAGGTGQRYC